MRTQQLTICVLLCGMMFMLMNCKSRRGPVISSEDETAQVDSVMVYPLEQLLQGLRPLTNKELNGRMVIIDGQALPVYDTSGKALKGNDIIPLTKNDSIIFEIFGDDSLEPKAVLARYMTKEEWARKQAALEPPQPPMETMLEYAPSFIAKDMEGNEVDLEELKGKVVVLNFWFIACKPCVEEMPDLNRLVAKYKDNEDVVFLAMTYDKHEKVAAFLKKNPFDFTIIPDAQKIVNEYIVMGFPTNLVIDPLGDIQYHSVGFRHQVHKILDKEIRKSLREKE